MSAKTKPSKPKLSDAEKVGVLAGSLLFVIKGLRSGSIKSKPILLMPQGAKEYEMVSLEDEIWEALGKCGITERKA